MARYVVEVVARLGTTIVDIAHVEPESVYRLGTAEIAIGPTLRTGLTSLDVGLVRIELSRVTLDPPRVPAAPLRWRMTMFAAASLLVHIAIWVCASLFEPLERLAVVARPALRLIHVEPAPPEPPPPPPVQARTMPSPPAASLPKPRPRVAKRERSAAVADSPAYASPAAAAAAMASMVANTHVVERVQALRPEDTYDEDAANAKGFGGSPRFPPGETIKTGEGYQLMLYDVKLCPKKSCTLSGPVPAEYVRAQLHAHMNEIYACFVEHGGTPGEIVLSFTIAGDGSVHDARGTGLGDTGACAARVLADIYFKAIGDNDVPDGKQRFTRVRYPIHFN